VQLGIAALFHDLGLSKVAPAILYKSGPLTPEESCEVQKHPEIAVALLQGCSEISPESLRLIWEHHENVDGSGYPQGLGITEQHEHTPLLRLVDSYDALICQRPYRPQSESVPGAENPPAAMGTPWPHIPSPLAKKVHHLPGPVSI